MQGEARRDAYTRAHAEIGLRGCEANDPVSSPGGSRLAAAGARST
jgi:hypothetical protein